MGTMAAWRQRARELKRLVHALAIASRDPRTPLLAKILAVIVVGYALSPIDLIPDPIPVLGYLDDLLLVPLGIALTIRLIPPHVWAEAQATALARAIAPGASGRVAAGIVVALWLAVAIVAVTLAMRWW